MTPGRKEDEVRGERYSILKNATSDVMVESEIVAIFIINLGGKPGVVGVYMIWML